MLIGAHVSPAGGPAKAVARGVERGAHAIQIFNQNPRAWKPRAYADEEVAAFRAAMAGSDVDALLIHAVYLLNCASEDPDIRAKSLASLTSSLRAGAALGAHAVVLHPGSALTGEVAPAIARAGAVIAEALAESDGCPLHLENTAGTGGTLGRSFEELAALIDAAGGDARLGAVPGLLPPARVGLRHPHARRASTPCSTSATRSSALERLGSLHLNDSQMPLGSNRDRHANVGEGEIGDGRLRGVPLRAALRGPAVRARDAGAEPHGADARGDRARARAARAGAGARAAPARAPRARLRPAQRARGVA